MSRAAHGAVCGAARRCRVAGWAAVAALRATCARTERSVWSVSGAAPGAAAGQRRIRTGARWRTGCPIRRHRRRRTRGPAVRPGRRPAAGRPSRRPEGRRRSRRRCSRRSRRRPGRRRSRPLLAAAEAAATAATAALGAGDLGRGELQGRADLVHVQLPAGAAVAVPVVVGARLEAALHDHAHALGQRLRHVLRGLAPDRAAQEQRFAVLPLVGLAVERAGRGRDGEVRDGRAVRGEAQLGVGGEVADHGDDGLACHGHSCLRGFFRPSAGSGDPVCGRRGSGGGVGD